MKLTIPKVPTFKTNLPSNGKEVEYRPYTVREESFLLQAKEVENEKEIIDAIFSLLERCVDGIKPSSLPIIDIEWLFLQIRIKSIGDIVEQHLRCLNIIDGQKCNARFESNIDLNDVTVSGNISSSITITFPAGTYKINFKQATLKNQPKEEIERIYQMIDTISDPINGILTQDDISLSDFEEFVSTFTNPQYESLKEAADSTATLYYRHVLECPKCGSKTENTYRSLLDFFT